MAIFIDSNTIIIKQAKAEFTSTLYAKESLGTRLTEKMTSQERLLITGEVLALNY